MDLNLMASYLTMNLERSRLPAAKLLVHRGVLALFFDERRRCTRASTPARAL